jgi:hypothetical protein
MENMPISLGYTKCYSAINSGLPVHENLELDGSYKYLRRFSKWAMNNRVCYKCRFPWVYGDFDCECGKCDSYKSRIKFAIDEAVKVLDFDKLKIQQCAVQIEKDMKGGSEYAILSNKAKMMITDLQLTCINIE